MYRPSLHHHPCVCLLQKKRPSSERVYRMYFSLYSLIAGTEVYFRYILGSAGTLMSDVTIVCQSFIYPSPKPRRTSTRGMDEEEAGLLDEDATEPTASR